MPIGKLSTLGGPLDIQAQEAALAREAAMAQALIAASMREHPTTIKHASSNPYMIESPNWGDPLRNFLDKRAGQQQLEDIARRQGELAGETQRMTEKDLAEALLARRGTPGMAPGAGEEPPVEAVPGNYNDYVQKLIMSKVPRLQAMGNEAAKHMINPQDVLKEGDKYLAGTAATAAQTGDLSKLAPKPTQHAYGGAVVTTDQQGRPVGPPAAIGTYGEVGIDPATGLPMQKSNVTGEAKAFTGGNVTVSNAAALKGVDATLDDIKKAKPEYLNNVKTMGKLAQAEYQINKAPESAFGTLSWLRTQGGKLGELLGADKLKSTSDIEGIRSILGSISLDKARVLAPVSDNDWDKIREILGTEGYTKRALQEVVQIMIQATARETGMYTQAVAAASKNPNIGGGDPQGFLDYWAPSYTTTPYQGGGGGAKLNPYSSMTDDEIRKKLGK